jgi:gliding motility-associated-like protein
MNTTYRIVKTTCLVLFLFALSLQLLGQVTFSVVPKVSLPDTPEELAKGDFNNDGKIDLVSCNFNSLTNQQITIFLNTGSGTFSGTNKRNFPSATNPTDVAVGDFNEDSKLDVVTCSQSNDNFSLLLGDGAGNLAAPVNIAAGDLPQGIAVGDMNKDNHLDVLVTNRGTPSQLFIYLGNGAGGFATPTIITIVNVWDIAVADFNGDTNLDFAVSMNGTVQPWFGNGTGATYTAGTVITGFNSVEDVIAANLDNDSDIDIIGGGGYTLNDGTGNFGIRVALTQTGNEYTVGDINKDDKPDIIANDHIQNTTNARILLGDGLGNFNLLAKIETNAYFIGVEVVDTNNDSNPDVVGVGSWGGVPNADVLLGDGTGYFSNAPTKYPSLTDPRDLAKGDFNEDGQIDIALCHSVGSIATIYLGQGNGKFSKTATNYTTGSFPAQIITMDYNKDNHLDLVTYNQSSSSVTVLTGAGNGSFSLLANFPVTSTITGRMTTADFNNDTNPDLVVSGYTSKVINYLSGTGTGFNAAVTIPTSADVIEIKAADFNSDGKVDIVADLSSINKFVLFLGNGTGGFTESATQYSHKGSFFLVEDINNDSKPDLIAFEIGSANDFFINDGAGNFTGSGIAVSHGGFPWGYADMNGDGFKDLIVGAQNSNSSQSGQVLIFRGTASGITSTILIDKDYSGGNRLVVHDVNSDGKMDIITISFNIYEDYLGVLINTTGPSPCTPPTISSVTLSTAVCVGQSIFLTVSASGTAPLAYQWKKGGTNITGATSSSLSLGPITASDAADYTCTVTNTCGNSTSSAITLTVNTTTPSPPAVAGVSSCTPASVTLTASGGTNGNYRWYTDGFDPDGLPIIEIIPAAVNNTYATPLLSKTTKYYVSIVNGSCESNRATAIATIGGSACNNQPPAINAVSLSTSIGGLFTLDLTALLSDPDNNLDLSTLQITIQPISGAPALVDSENNLVIDYKGISFSGTDRLTIEVCDLIGSCVQEELTIEVVGEIVVYNALSPNGDGKNDILLIEHIDALESTRENKVSIYNRWGDLVFEMENYDNQAKVFAGQSTGGKSLPTGVYYYKIELKSRNSLKTGYLYLKR